MWEGEAPFSSRVNMARKRASRGREPGARERRRRDKSEESPGVPASQTEEKQGHEPGEKKRQGPCCRPRTPPKEPHWHTPGNEQRRD